MKTRLFLTLAAGLLAAGSIAVWLHAAPQPHRLDAQVISAAAGTKTTTADDGGTGEPEKLATGVKAVWDAIKKVRADNPTPAARFAGDAPQAGKIDTAAIEKALGHKSEAQDGVVKVTIKREGKMHGVTVGGS